MTIQDVFEVVGAHAAGKVGPAEVHALENVACPGAGACGGQFTANTMSMAMELIGISPAGLNGIPANHPLKAEAAAEAGRLAMRLVRSDTRPHRDPDAQGHRQRHRGVAASGGSTNAVLHLLAIAQELGIALEIDEFDEIAERTPIIVDLTPGGRFVATDLHAAGGVRGDDPRAAVGGPGARRDPQRRRPHLAEIGAAVAETPDKTSSCRSRRRSSRPAGSPCFTATSPPTAAS